MVDPNFDLFVCGQLNSFDRVNFFGGQYRRATFRLRHFLSKRVNI